MRTGAVTETVVALIRSSLSHLMSVFKVPRAEVHRAFVSPPDACSPGAWLKGIRSIFCNEQLQDRNMWFWRFSFRPLGSFCDSCQFETGKDFFQCSSAGVRLNASRHDHTVTLLSYKNGGPRALVSCDWVHSAHKHRVLVCSFNNLRHTCSPGGVWNGVGASLRRGIQQDTSREAELSEAEGCDILQAIF